MSNTEPSNSLRFSDPKEYRRIHEYLRRHNKKNLKCDFCGSSSKKKYEFALKKNHGYSVDKGNYFELCVSCHRKYDTSEHQRELSKIRSKGAKPHNKGVFGDESKNAKKIAQIDIKTFEVICVYDSLVSAEKQTGIKRGGISWCASGNQSHAGGFLWKKI